MTVSFIDLPVELGTLILYHLLSASSRFPDSHLSPPSSPHRSYFSELLILRSVCREMNRKLFLWAPTSFIRLASISDLNLKSFEDLLGNMAYTVPLATPKTHLSPTSSLVRALLHVGSHGRILLQLDMMHARSLDCPQPRKRRPSLWWRPSGMRITLKSLFRMELSLDAAVEFVMESDPYSFRLKKHNSQWRQKEGHEWRRDSVLDHEQGDPEPHLVSGPFAISLKAFVRGTVSEAQSESDQTREYKQSLYPLERSHPLVSSHVRRLLLECTTSLESLVDGTVGMIPDLSSFDNDSEYHHEPPHWQSLTLSYSPSGMSTRIPTSNPPPIYGEGHTENTVIELVGRELPQSFTDPRSAWNSVELLSRRWSVLYAPLLSSQGL